MYRGGTFLHTFAQLPLTTTFFFFFSPSLWDHSLKIPEMVVQENPCRSAVCAIPGAARLAPAAIPHSESLAVNLLFLPQSELRQVVFTTSKLKCFELLLSDWPMSCLCYQAIKWPVSGAGSVMFLLKPVRSRDKAWEKKRIPQDRGKIHLILGWTASFMTGRLRVFSIWLLTKFLHSTINWISMPGGAFWWDVHIGDSKRRIHLG